MSSHFKPSANVEQIVECLIEVYNNVSRIAFLSRFSFMIHTFWHAFDVFAFSFAAQKTLHSRPA